MPRVETWVVCNADGSPHSLWRSREKAFDAVTRLHDEDGDHPFLPQEHGGDYWACAEPHCDANVASWVVS
jgi:hypothetical protein